MWWNNDLCVDEKKIAKNTGEGGGIICRGYIMSRRDVVRSDACFMLVRHVLCDTFITLSKTSLFKIHKKGPGYHANSCCVIHCTQLMPTTPTYLCRSRRTHKHTSAAAAARLRSFDAHFCPRLLHAFGNVHRIQRLACVSRGKKKC